MVICNRFLSIDQMFSWLMGLWMVCFQWSVLVKFLFTSLTGQHFKILMYFRVAHDDFKSLKYIVIGVTCRAPKFNPDIPDLYIVDK